MAKAVKIISDGTIKTNYDGNDILPKRTPFNSPFIRLIADDGKDFFRYLNLLDLTNDPNILVLSSRHQYYYNHNELQCITTLIVLQKLNFIKYIDVFLKSLNNAISPATNFIGSFSDSNNQNGSGLISRLYKKSADILDSKFERKFSREDITILLESQGFQVIDMRVINGLTYFRTQKQLTD
jgi:hypothetical protein